MAWANSAMNGTRRESQIQAKQNAIQRRLDKENKASEVGAKVKSNKVTPKGGTYRPTKYQEKYIKGEKEGFSKSDFGAGAGAAIPYQVGSRTKTYTGQKGTAKRPSMPNKKGTARRAGGHTSYKVKRGDTLSGIANKKDMSWKDIWDYNIQKRSKSTVKTLKKRGPNLIYKGGTFYIPNK